MAPLTLTEAARTLEVPQHRLIHLCEKGVVVPDGAGAHGRGSSRKFSRRNLFEFAIALEMRKLDLPVAFVHAVLRVLRTFEEAVRSARRGFRLPESLTPTGPRLALVILDGERLYFSLTSPQGRQVLYGGVEIKHPRVRGRSRRHRALGRLAAGASRAALAQARTRIEVDLTGIAMDLLERAK